MMTVSSAPQAPVASAELLADMLAEQLAQQLAVDGDELDRGAPFASFGLKSKDVVAVASALETQLGFKLDPVALYNHPTIDALADYLARRAWSAHGIIPKPAAPEAVDARPSDEPIAIVGMGLRFPQGVNDAEQLWRVLDQGLDLVTEIPRERWDAQAYYDPDPDAVGRMITRCGGFLDQHDRFDPAFFGISEREACGMDPQQRVLMEVTWEALEHAGIVPASLMHSDTGVFVGLIYREYEQIAGAEPSQLNGYVATGNASSVGSGRISYCLGLRGPSLSVDTACSSSLVALHLACQSLRAGECSLALAGGASLLLTPGPQIEMSRQRVLAPDGRSKTFDAAADGATWSEGAGVLVLKRLSAAQAQGDRILAVVRGTAVNQDGRSSGLTAPYGPSQEAVVRRALRNAGLSPDDIDYVEAHGTGTALGDPIEALALGTVFKSEERKRPLWLGSIKSNFGHAQAAAGVAGVIKVVLALERERIPKTLHFREPSPHVPWHELPLAVAGEAQPWPRAERARRAGVSSFGISGTNAHAILEEAPARLGGEQASPAVVEVALPLLVSGRDEAALRDQAARLARFLREHPTERFADVVHSAAFHRTHFEQRAAVLATCADGAVAALEALAQGQRHAASLEGKAKARGKVVFVCPGQGAQWPGMGRELLEQSETFARTLEDCDAALAPWTGWSLLSLLRGETAPELPPFDRVDAVQPALFALSVGLAAVFREFGVEPAAVVGHSQGEVAAAVIAGALSLADGARIAALRSRAVRRCSGAGGMLLVERPLAEVEGWIAPYGAALSIGGINAASSTVVSGDIGAIEALARELGARSLFCRRVNIDYASHTTHMDPLLPGLARELGSIAPRASRVAFYSTVHGRLVSGESLDADYWCANLRQPVRLDQALAQLLADGHGAFVELSPHPVLALSLAAACEQHGGVVVGGLQRERGDLGQLLRRLAELHVAGLPVDWQKALVARPGRLISLPSYAFQRQRYWVEAGRAWRDVRALGLDSVEHPLLGALVPLADDDGYVFSSQLSLSSQPWLAAHAVHGAALLPGTAMLELALHAARAVGLTRVADLTLEQPLALSDGAVQLQLSVGAAGEDGARRISLYSRSDEQPWLCHATGMLEVARDGAPLPASRELAAWPVAGSQAIDLAGFYPRLATRGLDYGPAFQGLTELCLAGDVAYARVLLPESVRAAAAGYDLHPALLDAVLHALAARGGDDGSEVLLPFAWSDVELHAAGATELRARIEIVERTDAGLTASVSAVDAAGTPVVSVGALHMRPARLADEQKARVEHLYRVELRPVALPSEPAPGAHMVLGGTGALATLLAAPRLPELDAASAQDAAPQRLIVDATDALPLAAERVGELTAQALSWLQQWLRDERLRETELVWVTAGAIGAGDGEVADLVHAPLWGLVRAARAEHPERALRLIDVGTRGPDAQLLARALSAQHEPELVLRGDEALAPRLCAAGARGEGDAERAGRSTGPRELSPDGTVLITGGTGELGSALAEQLVVRHGVKHLLLTSRRGAEAPGADGLVEHLRGLGAASVQLVACDVSVRSELAAALARVSERHPLTGVFHLAGTLDDGAVEAQTPERFRRVFAPKVDGALHLHELTRGRELAAFVAFSSAAGTLGSPGQSNYAAANAWLDALCAYRRQQGLAGQSLAWGLWQPAGTGLTATLGKAELSRLARRGIAALSPAQGLSLLSAALGRSEAQLVPIRLELRAFQREDALEPPALLRGLLRPKLRRAAVSRQQAAELRERLAALPEEERLEHVLALVRREAAGVLGLADAGALDPNQELRKYGLDSLLGVELRNRLATLTATTLPATLAFDYPSCRAVAGLLLRQLAPAGEQGVSLSKHDVEAVAEWLRQASLAQIDQQGVRSMLQTLREKLKPALAAAPAPAEDVRLGDGDEMIQFLKQKFGMAR